MVMYVLTVLVILVCVAFLALVVYPILRVVYCVILDVRKERRPRAQITHPQLGLLTCDEGLWCGETVCDERRLGFCIAGDETAPDEGLLAVLQEKLASIDQWEQAALDLLCRDERVESELFTLKSLDFLWPDRPDSFALEFEMEGDPDGIWRVEFQNNQAVHTGRDD